MENYTRNLSEIIFTVKPLLYLSKILGLAPISINFFLQNEKTLSKKSIFKRSDRLYSCILVLFIAFSTVLVFINLFLNYLNGETDNNNMYFLDLLILGIATIVNIAVCLLKFPGKIDKLFHKISLLGEYLNMKGNSFTKHAYFVRVQVCSVIVFYFILCIIDAAIWYKHDYYWNLYVTIEGAFSLSSFIMVMQFVDFTLAIKKCIQEIYNSLVYCEFNDKNGLSKKQCKLLNKMYIFLDDPVNYRQNIFISTNYQHSRTLHIWPCFPILRVLQDTVCDISSLVNSLYGLQILTLFLTNFIQITSNFNFLIIQIMSASKLDFWKLALSTDSILWSIVHFVMLLCIAMSCNSASKESEITAELLQKLLLLPQIKQITAAEIQQFIQQVIIRKIQFTAYDFFVLDHKILVSVIGAVTTLLVIIAQFQYST